MEANVEICAQSSIGGATAFARSGGEIEQQARLTFADIVCIACFLLVLLAYGAHMARAQSSLRDDSPATPRIANRYDHKEFQATTNSVCVGANADGVDCSSAAGTKAEAQLNLIWRQIQQIEQSYPPGFLSGTKGKAP
jgi:hypothetical protein